MLPSLAVYAGLLIAFLGFVCLLRPMRWLRLGTRRRAALALAAGLAATATGFFWPVSLTRVSSPSTRLDVFLPTYQARERHSIVVHASAEQVDRALRQVTASEITFFRTLTWIRRLGRPVPASILNPPEQEPILGLATRTGFLMLADEPGRELVLGTFAAAPRPSRLADWTPEKWQAVNAPGYAKAAMNFRIEEMRPGECLLTTETRVYATDPATARLLGRYWRVIYPGSALIRIMWLRAIRARAEREAGT
jgi:hypothetical protein